MEISNHRILRLPLKTKLSKSWTKKKNDYFLLPDYFLTVIIGFHILLPARYYSIIDFLIDGQLSSFCPDQTEAEPFIPNNATQTYLIFVKL